MNLDILPLLLFVGLVISVLSIILSDLEDREEEIRFYEDEDMR